MKPVLKIPVYRRLLAAYALNELAFMVGTIALALLVYRRTGSALGATAFFLAAQFVPALISPMAVARLDQLSARTVLPVLHWLEAAIFVVLAWVASDHFSVVAVLVLAFLDGVLALTARALTRAATVSVTSAVGLLREGNAVSNAAFSVCFMFGPAVGGALVVAGGTSVALLANAGIFAVCGLVLATARGLPEPAPERAETKGRLRAALAYVREVPEISRLILLQGVAVLFFTISVPVEVVFAQHSLHAGAAGYGGMVSAWGAGAVAGAAVYARWRRRPNRELIVGGAASLGVGFLVMAAAPTLTVAIVGAALGGVGNGVESVAVRTAIQEEASEQWMAIMMSLYEAIFQSVPGAGMLIGGGLTALGSPRTALAVAGAGSLAVTVTAWFALTGLGSRLKPEAEDGPAPQADGAQGTLTDAIRETQIDALRPGSRRDAPRTPAVRHQ
ncbi:MAG TPA: MFS transporter [Solirubrobacteraceae bacterium]|nr:MFS transporter [Solirubrobacteraceae bacterium]